MNETIQEEKPPPEILATELPYAIGDTFYCGCGGIVLLNMARIEEKGHWHCGDCVASKRC